MMRKCVDCMNFLTEELTKKNKTLRGIKLTKAILCHLKKDGQVRVFFCRYARHSQDVYINSPKVFALQVDRCKLFCNVV